MTPEQMQAFQEELEKFRKHPFNKKHRIVRQSKYSTAWYLPLPHMPDGEFSTAVYPEDFQLDREIPRMYTFRALLIQRIKEALRSERFSMCQSVHEARPFVWSRWKDPRPERTIKGMDRFEVGGYPDDIVRLLRAINQSDIWQEVES